MVQTVHHFSSGKFAASGFGCVQYAFFMEAPCGRPMSHAGGPA